MGRPDALPLQCTLKFVEHMGSEVYVHADLDGLAVSARVPAEQAQALAEAPRGAPCTLHAWMSHAHLFDAQTGAALA